ncbi:MAG: hypothetical protein ACM3TR_20940 [Caulobacteraceae bacterium]
MNAGKVRLLKGCLTFIITAAILYVGQHAWQSYAVEKPLDNALKNVAGVRQVTWQDSNKVNEPMNIYVTLDNSANLQKTYNEINQKIVQTLNGKPYTLEFKDTRTPELEKLYYDINNYVQKAIVDGNFPQLAEKTQEKAKAAGVEAQLYVDKSNVYLQLTKKDNSLYTVISRQSEGMGGEAY